jgi:hypothetical protein
VIRMPAMLVTMAASDWHRRGIGRCASTMFAV